MADDHGFTPMSIFEKMFMWVLSLFWSAFACVKLAMEWYKHRDTFFDVKEHLKPKVLDGWTNEFVQLSEVKLHYVEAGDMDHPLMLMIHGFPEFWYSWRYQLRHFQKNYHVVAVDMRGYNDSDKPEGAEHYHASTIAKDIKELIAALNHNKAILVGHDWGAAITWTVAAQYPEVVDKLIVCNCPHPLAFRQLLRTNLKQLLKSWWRTTFIGGGLCVRANNIFIFSCIIERCEVDNLKSRYMFMFQMPSLPEYMNKAEDFAFLKKTLRGEPGGIKNAQNFTDEDMDAWLYVYSKPNAFHGPINFYRASLSKGGPPSIPETPIKAPKRWKERNFIRAGFVLQEAILQVNEKFQARTLIVWGTEDAFIEKCSADMSTQYCERAQVAFIDGASHWVQQDCPEAVNEHIEKFLQHSD